MTATPRNANAIRLARCLIVVVPPEDVLQPHGSRCGLACVFLRHTEHALLPIL